MDQLTPPPQNFKSKRVRQILWSALCAFCGVSIGTYFYGNNGYNLLIYISCLCVLSFSFFLLQRNKVDLAANFTLWTITLVCSLLMLLNTGLHDAGLLAFPGLLIVGAMIGTPRLLISLFAYMVIFVALLGTATIQHKIDFSNDNAVTGETIVDIVVILSAITFSIWLLSNDLKSLLGNLEKENTRVRESKAEIAHIARHDALTGLPNRALCEENFYQSLARSMRTKEKIALVFLDVDNFKTINDSLGHGAGDKLLIELTHRIQANSRANDRLSRLGGDEFLMIIENVTSNDAVSEFVNKLLTVINQPITIDQTDVTCSCSIGIAICPDDANNFSQLRKKADMAMYKAKEAGRNTFCFYDDAMNTGLNEYLALVAGLRNALANKEFRVLFQPKHDVRSGNIIGAEALVRWHPEFGAPIPPNKFIPAAESTGLIVDIGEWVLMESCMECKRWHDLGFVDFTIAVNMSVVQFRRGNINNLVQRALEYSKLPAHALELELTESLLVDDSSNIKQQLQALRTMGIAIAIDDFGTGYSNLGYLNKFDIGTLKIDQSFIRNIVTQCHDKAIVRAIIQIANSLNMKTVAEGVEDHNTLALLQELQCDYFQGYLRAPALTAGAFVEYATQHSLETC